MHMDLSVYNIMSVWTHTGNSKTIASIELMCCAQEVIYPLLGPPLRLGSESGLKDLFTDSSNIGRQNIPSKYATTSNVRLT